MKSWGKILHKKIQDAVYIWSDETSFYVQLSHTTMITFDLEKRAPAFLYDFRVAHGLRTRIMQAVRTVGNSDWLGILAKTGLYTGQFVRRIRESWGMIEDSWGILKINHIPVLEQHPYNMHRTVYGSIRTEVSGILRNDRFQNLAAVHWAVHKIFSCLLYTSDAADE